MNDPLPSKPLDADDSPRLGYAIGGLVACSLLIAAIAVACIVQRPPQPATAVVSTSAEENQQQARIVAQKPQRKGDPSIALPPTNKPDYAEPKQPTDKGQPTTATKTPQKKMEPLIERQPTRNPNLDNSEPKQPRGAALAITVEGNWLDNQGNEIAITQDGTQVAAVAKSAEAWKWWTTATGTINGTAITLQVMKGNIVGNKISGTVADDRINWKNKDGRYWRKATKTNREPNTPLANTLAGKWMDSGGGEIVISQNGTQVTAVGKNAKVLKWWTTGTGTLNGKKIAMTHKKGTRVVDRVSGSVVADDRINWQNGSHWKRTSRTVDEPKTPLGIMLTGNWLDNQEREIAITQNGIQLTAVPKSAKLLKWWTTANGTLKGKTIALTFKKGSRVGSTVSGTAVSDDRINWKNGSLWKKTSKTDSAPKTIGLAEWLKRVRESEIELNKTLAAGKHEAKDNQLRPLTIWRSGSRNNRMPDSKVPENLQSSAKDIGWELKIRSVRFRDFDAAFDDALANDALPDILIINNYGTLDSAKEKVDGSLVLVKGAFPFSPAPAILFPSSKHHQSAKALALRKPQPPSGFKNAKNNLNDQDSEELKSLCLASFKAYVSDDTDAVISLSDALTAKDVIKRPRYQGEIDVMSVDVSGMVGNDRLAVVHINSRTKNKSANPAPSVGHFGSLARVFICRKSDMTWKVLLSANGGSKMSEDLIDVVGKMPAKTDSTPGNMQVPTLVSPEDGARLTRSPRPDISWETCGAKDAKYFVESQYSSRRIWSESWLKKIDGVNSEGETITIKAPFGIGSQPHRWRVWAISNSGQVTLSGWRTINYRN